MASFKDDEFHRKMLTISNKMFENFYAFLIILPMEVVVLVHPLLALEALQLVSTVVQIFTLL